MAQKKLPAKIIAGREINPRVKKGDLVMCSGVKYSETAQSLGVVGKVTEIYSGYIYTDGGMSMGSGCERHEYVLATIEDKIESKRRQLTEKNKNFEAYAAKHHEEVDIILKEIEHMEKFPTEEDYAAYKLDKLLTAHKAGDPSALASVLKELKSSNVL